MAQYIHFFETGTEYNTKRSGANYVEPWVSYTDENDKVNYNKTEYEKLLETPLTFEIISDGTIWWKNGVPDASCQKTIEYKKNNGEWTSITSTSGSGAPEINVTSGDTIQFRGNNTSYGYAYNGNDSRGSQFSGSCQFKIIGNIMSLINATNFISLNTITDNYAFKRIFMQCTGLTDAENLILPATTLSSNCYHSMFEGCSGLTAAPVLPAMVLTNYCYYHMFSGCSSLSKTPKLPSTSLAISCYGWMFSYCTSLTSAPELPATTLAASCYSNMFYGCSGLTTPPKKIGNSETVIPVSGCSAMFLGCTSLTSAPELPAESLSSYGYWGMFSGCTSLVNAPDLPVTSVSSYCCTSMFSHCSSLTKVASTLPATTLNGATACYRQMFDSCGKLTYGPELPATTLADYCYYQMFHGCRSLTQAPELPATALTNYCYYEMFNWCTELTNAPDLTAPTLMRNCYYQMFAQCEKLNSIKCLATDKSATSCTGSWLNGVSTTGVFIKSPNIDTSTWTIGSSGIPRGWTVEDAAQ